MRVFKKGSREPVATIKPAADVNLLSITEDGAYVAGSTGAKVYVWDVKTGKELFQFPFGGANMMSFGPKMAGELMVLRLSAELKGPELDERWSVPAGKLIRRKQVGKDMPQ